MMKKKKNEAREKRIVRENKRVQQAQKKIGEIPKIKIKMKNGRRSKLKLRQPKKERSYRNKKEKSEEDNDMERIASDVAVRQCRKAKPESRAVQSQGDKWSGPRYKVKEKKKKKNFGERKQHHLLVYVACATPSTTPPTDSKTMDPSTFRRLPIMLVHHQRPID